MRPARPEVRPPRPEARVTDPPAVERARFEIRTSLRTDFKIALPASLLTQMMRGRWRWVRIEPKFHLQSTDLRYDI